MGSAGDEKFDNTVEQINDTVPDDTVLDTGHIYDELGLAGPPVIVLDPGHSGTDIASVDPESGLNDHDYPNFPEIYEVWDVAQKVGANLKAAGYEVVFTKNSALDSVSLRQRSNIAQQAKADLAVSIHDDHTQKYNDCGEVFAQELGLWRGGTASNPKVKFSNKEIADESQEAAEIFVAERSRAEGRPVELTQVNFAGRPGIDPGNITQVQLYSGAGPHPVPWVYNEVGGIGYGPEQEAAYVKGLTEAIMKSVPLVVDTQADSPAENKSSVGVGSNPSHY